MSSAQNPEEAQSPTTAFAGPIGNRPAQGARQISAAEAFGPNGLLQETGGDFLGLAHEVPGEITPEGVPAPAEPPQLTVAPSKQRARVDATVATLEPQPPPLPSARARRPKWVSFAVAGICVAALGVVAVPSLGSKDEKDVREAAPRTAASSKKASLPREPVAAQSTPVEAAPEVVEPLVASVLEPVFEPDVESDVEPVAEPVVEPTQVVPLVQIFVEPVDESMAICLDEATLAPTDAPVAASAPTDAPSVDGAEVAVATAPIVPTAESVVEALPEPEASVEPIAEPVAEPVVEPVVEPVAEPNVEPVIEPVIEPAGAGPISSDASSTPPSTPPSAPPGTQPNTPAGNPPADGPALEGVVMLWSSNEIPHAHIRGAARMQTPNVGEVRLTTSEGESFSGRLVSVGQGKVWLNVEPLGKLAFDVARVKEVAKPTVANGAELDKGVLAVGGYAKARTDGGTLYGKVLALDSAHVTLLVDGGARVTVETARVEPAKAPVAKDQPTGKVKVKKLEYRSKPAPRPPPKPAPKPKQ